MTGIQKTIRAIPFFQHLSENDIKDLSAAMKELTFDSGGVICKEGDPGDSFFAVVSGKIKILKELSETEEQVLSVRGAGTFFGEMALVDNKPRSATVVAQQKTTLLALNKNDFLELVQRRPSVSLSVIRILSERLRDTDEIMIESLKWKNIELEGAYNRLSELNKSLEQRVTERTVELERKNEELEETLKVVRKMQLQLVQSEKIASLGKMVAGIAHELNNPLGVISGNIDFIEDYVTQFDEMIAKFSAETSGTLAAVEKIKMDSAYDTTRNELREVVESCKRSAERTKNIVSDLRTFSRLDELEVNSIDLNEDLQKILHVLESSYGDRATIHLEKAELPEVECYVKELNQALLNILTNAYEAIGTQGEIWIKTSTTGKNTESVSISIRDSGPGIDPDILPKIFDPFFTTKPVGSGTGLGLAMAYSIIERHRGSIKIAGNKGAGAKFIITIPVRLAAR